MKGRRGWVGGWIGRRLGRQNSGKLTPKVDCPETRCKTSTEQEGIYRGKSSSLLRSIHVDPTYTVGKALGIFLESVHFGFLRNLFRLLEHRRQNLTKMMWENRGQIKCDWLKSKKSKHNISTDLRELFFFIALLNTLLDLVEGGCFQPPLLKGALKMNCGVIDSIEIDMHHL